MNEAEYLMKNYGDQRGILHMIRKAEFNNCFIIHSK